MVQLTSRTYGPKEVPVYFCGDIAQDHFASVAIVANPRFIHFDEETRILYDKRSSERFTDIELAKARFDKPRVLGRTEFLTIVALGDVVFLVSNDKKIQSIVRRERFEQIKDRLIEEISGELSEESSKRLARTPSQHPPSSPTETQSSKLPESPKPEYTGLRNTPPPTTEAR